ncbi:hypothetical protein [Marinobacter shengliensis]|uniref:hypothetical protein n=1 Tax=Marinobacter shengliensis TaxID=1389223 RepID=UPI002572A57F|nr:hypothetical protein [Marinobacter shengliensis]BEH16714.1 hypothetical protein MAALD49_40820 [Marinobacter shengliensis]
MERSFFDALDVIATQDTVLQFEPVGDQSTELDEAAEVAAFVGRPSPALGVQTEREEARVMDKTVGMSTGRTPFAEAAGLLSSGR